MGGALTELLKDELGFSKGLGAEQDPADTDQVKGEEDTERSRELRREEAARLCRAPFVEGAGRGERDAVQRAPGDEGPVGAMPQTAEQHGEDQVDVGAD